MKTRLTEFFGIDHPIVSAPMALASGGKLAAAVSSSGGLGLIGGGYADSEWVAREFGLADGARVGCGFITWSLARNPDVLDVTLERQPATIMLSFGDLHPFAERIHAAGVPSSRRFRRSTTRVWLWMPALRYWWPRAARRAGTE